MSAAAVAGRGRAVDQKKCVGVVATTACERMCHRPWHTSRLVGSRESGRGKGGRRGVSVYEIKLERRDRPHFARVTIRLKRNKFMAQSVLGDNYVREWGKAKPQ